MDYKNHTRQSLNLACCWAQPFFSKLSLKQSSSMALYVTRPRRDEGRIDRGLPSDDPIETLQWRSSGSDSLPLGLGNFPFLYIKFVCIKNIL